MQDCFAVKIMPNESHRYTIIYSLVGIYLLTVVYNIVLFHSSGLGSTDMAGSIETIKDSFGIKFDDDLASKLHSAHDNDKTITSYRHETNVFKQMLARSANDAEICSNLHPDHLGEAKPKDFDTGVPPLPENGVHEVLQAWLDGGHKDRGDYPMCEIPPTKSCDVSQYSLILMSHTVSDNKRLSLLRKGIDDFAQRQETAEIILVWNSEKEVLLNSDKKDAKLLVEWNNDISHPLRIFFSLDNGLGNNLLNRYHPMLKPKSEAIMYFDDDGPFYSEEAMHAGFSLWKFNSDVQVGSLTRNIRFTSKRMNELQIKATEVAAEHYRKDSWHTHIHPYDTEAVKKAMVESNETEPGYPQFTPLCRDETGDNVEYNYFVFPNFRAHMSLPSGSLIHRNYMCFVWHPVFAELRQFILDHPTHPDDMTISTLITHLSGKPIRTFPRQWRKKKESSRRLRDNGQMMKIEEDSDNDISIAYDDDESHFVNKRRRKLLWQQKDWGNMREEAINSILGYFGSINPGSVGWCAGTEYEKAAEGKGNMGFNCDPEYPEGAHMIPWLHEGGLGYDECTK